MSVYEVRYGTVDLCPQWALVGPDGLFVGAPFNCFEDAERVCTLCNDAYNRGVEAGTLAARYQASCRSECAGAKQDALEARVAKLEETIRRRL